MISMYVQSVWKLVRWKTESAKVITKIIKSLWANLLIISYPNSIVLYRLYVEGQGQFCTATMSAVPAGTLATCSV